jgi:hypothetical protein
LLAFLLVSKINLFPESKPALQPKIDWGSLTMGMNYQSIYLWRGNYLFADDGVLTSGLTYARKGFSLQVAREVSEDYLTQKDKNDKFSREFDDYHSMDYGAGYAYDYQKYLTVGLDFWYIHFPRKKNLNFFTGRIFLKMDALPLKPMFSYSHDYLEYTQDKKDFYLQIGISHEISAQGTIFSLSLTPGYYQAPSMAKKGFSDISTVISVSGTIDSVTLTGSFTYVFVPARDYYEVPNQNGILVRDRHRTYLNFGFNWKLW